MLPSHTLFGALAGGPSSPNDQFVDDRGDFIANEVACDYNAGFTGAIARMYSEFGGQPLANFPEEEEPNRDEIRSLGKFNSNNPFGSTIRVRIQNRTAWSARVTDKLSFRYFIDIFEAVSQGFSINDFDIQTNFSQGPSTTSVQVWDAQSNIYYVEVSLTGDPIAPIGDPQFRREVQINIQAKNGAPYYTSNDFSANGLGNSEEIVSPNIRVYDDGELVFGTETVTLSNNEFGKEEFVIYPDPTIDILSIKGNFEPFDNVKVVITGITGNRIKTMNKVNETNKMSFNTSALQSGLYFLNIYSNNEKITTTKFIKL